MSKSRKEGCEGLTCRLVFGTVIAAYMRIYGDNTSTRELKSPSTEIPMTFGNLKLMSPSPHSDHSGQEGISS